MDIWQAIEDRHSVRQYELKPIEEDIIHQLNHEIALCQQESGLKIQLICNEPQAFQSFFVHYGRFKNVHNYIAFIIKSDDDNEKVGYFGERVVLKAQQLGLNTCWVGATYHAKKVPCSLHAEEKIACVITVGYGITQGKPHKSLPMEKCCLCIDEKTEWFEKGMQAVMLAPTAMNSQKFFLTLKDHHVDISSHGSYDKINLGIVKYHFEQGSQKDSSIWL
ncbi:nitroreductase family protein [Candidatus Stoquefichus massiliensis]|uniref:nitroreductase family protein n=1 Tax=Candidatus Stoquefichus massiliensis TaxID=1470350 RepID=UPI000483D3D1|nr:nitroreductase family protein [Candidatus Stoquefichus massiliensis]